MIERVRLTVVVDNVVRHRVLLGEHGWAVWIEADDHVLRHNLEALNIDLRAVQAVVLSHGHYDHTGGLNGVPPARLHLHPAALAPKFSGGRLRRTGSSG